MEALKAKTKRNGIDGKYSDKTEQKRYRSNDKFREIKRYKQSDESFKEQTKKDTDVVTNSKR